AVLAGLGHERQAAGLPGQIVEVSSYGPTCVDVRQRPLPGRFVVVFREAGAHAGIRIRRRVEQQRLEERPSADPENCRSYEGSVGEVKGPRDPAPDGGSLGTDDAAGSLGK